MPRTPGKRRYIFNTLTVVSLVLMLATVGLWVRSYWYLDSFEFHSNQLRTRDFISGYGVITYWRTVVQPMPQSATWTISEIKDGFSRFIENMLYFRHAQSSVRFSTSIPHWFFTLIFTILPMIWLFKWNKRRKFAMVGTCPSCGYDLTGNVIVVCPECGAESKAEV